MLKVPIRLIVMTRVNDASACGPSLPTVFSPIAMPAQFTSPRSVPICPAASTTACASASLVTSHFTKRALAPSSRASASPLSACTSAMTTLPPLAARSREVRAAESGGAAGDDEYVVLDLHGVPRSKAEDSRPTGASRSVEGAAREDGQADAVGARDRRLPGAQPHHRRDARFGVQSGERQGVAHQVGVHPSA